MKKLLLILFSAVLTLVTLNNLNALEEGRDNGVSIIANTNTVNIGTCDDYTLNIDNIITANKKDTLDFNDKVTIKLVYKDGCEKTNVFITNETLKLAVSNKVILSFDAYNESGKFLYNWDSIMPTSENVVDGFKNENNLTVYTNELSTPQKEVFENAKGFRVHLLANGLKPPGENTITLDVKDYFNPGDYVINYNCSAGKNDCTPGMVSGEGEIIGVYKVKEDGTVTVTYTNNYGDDAVLVKFNGYDYTNAIKPSDATAFGSAMEAAINANEAIKEELPATGYYYYISTIGANDFYGEDKTLVDSKTEEGFNFKKYFQVRLSISDGTGYYSTKLDKLLTPQKVILKVNGLLEGLEEGHARDYYVVSVVDGEVKKVPATLNFDGTAIEFEVTNAGVIGIGYIDSPIIYEYKIEDNTITSGNDFSSVVNNTLAGEKYQEIIGENPATVTLSSEEIELDNKTKKLFTDAFKEGTISKALSIKINLNVLGKDYEIADLTSEIEILAYLPELPSVAKGYERKYYILRNHEGKVEKLDATLTSDGKALKFKSDKFSEYVIAYVDTLINNPKTGDAISTYIVIGLTSLLVIGIGLYLVKRNTNKILVK